MEPTLGRRQNLVAVLIAGALFFTALGFFVATNVRPPRETRAQDLWVNGTGLTDSQRNVPSFTSIVEKMRGSVVRIVVTGKPGTGTTGDLPFDHPPTSTPDQTPPSTSPEDQQNPPGTTPGTTTTTLLPPGHPDIPPDFEQTSEGSGFVIRKDGYILTNQHVIEGGETIEVFFQAESKSFKAEVVGSDSRDDLALIKIEPDGDLPVAVLGDSDKMGVGDWVLAMGNPYGFDYSATVGVVSGKARRLSSARYVDFLQTDAAIYPGNSGGPLLNLAGEVIAVNTAVISNTNLGFAVPINTAKEILPDLLEKGEVTRGYLGVSVRSATTASTVPKGVQEGAIVLEVHPGGPAQKAGLRAGDTIVGFNGKPVDGSDTLTELVTRTRPGSRTNVEVIREGKRVQIQVVVGSLPAELQ